ncbi:MAG: hypothetical protein CM15mP130_1760 [Verrucomicrobiota bacterium]|nr:MAG: hypothetical protein CM15mP130_1760 [Verrucomicrobiota bacterium]
MALPLPERSGQNPIGVYIITNFFFGRKSVVFALASEGKNGNATDAPVVVMNCLRENFIKYYVIM